MCRETWTSTFTFRFTFTNHYSATPVTCTRLARNLKYVE
jgi:hypothetical protein